MYNRPIYMREGGYASSFGSSINPSFGNNGVLENIQEQVSNNGDVLKSMQGGMSGSPFSPIMERPGPTVPEGIFQNPIPGMPSENIANIDNQINNDPRFNLSVGAEQNPGMDYSQFKPQINDVMGSGFRQEGDMARYVAFNDPGQGGYGFSNAEEYNAANPNRPYQQSKPTNIFETYATSPLQSASSSINNPAVLQPTNSGTDSFPSGMLQNEMFGNMGRLQNIQQFANGGLADMGRFGDNQMVHAQTGEMVVPQSILQENPQIGMGLNQALVNQGLDPQRQVVGSNAGSINPMTGQQEFFDLGKIIKTIAPIAISAYLGPAAGAGLGSMFGAGTAGASFMSNPFVSRAITGALTSKLTGGSNKDALKNALLSGVSGAAFDGFSGSGTEVGSDVVTGGGSGNVNMGGSPGGKGYTSVPTSGGSGGSGVSSGVKPSARTFSGQLLKSAGVGDDNIFAKLMNTQMGEGLTAGLIAQLLAGNDKEEDQRSEYERRPFGYGGPSGKLGGITYANMGGPMGFPRRNGGIDPSEGSGKKDDVPAMLMAGEFVLTKDAVKGLGNGNQRQGIQKAYDMMENLEARA